MSNQQLSVEILGDNTSLSQALKRSSSDIQKFADDGQKSIGGFVDVFAVVGQALASVGIIEALKSIAVSAFSVNVEFQKLHGQLVTVTGSSAAAAEAFAGIQTFAKETPFQVNEVTDAFVALKTRGMDASLVSMRAYGDMAAAFSRPITDLIQAVGSLAMGEAEALKSFGVQAKIQGDKIAVTFHGQTEVIDRTTRAVEAYIQGIAQSNFEGGMARQMATLGGAVSNLKDQIDATMFALGNAGASEAMANSISTMTKALADSTPFLASLVATLTKGITATVTVVDHLKYAFLALIAVQIAPWINLSISGLGALAMQKARVIALTLALELSTLRYASAAGLASVASSAFGSALAAIASPMGMLTVGMVALQLVTRSIQNEIDALEEKTRAQAEHYNTVLKPVLDVRDATKALAEENKFLRGQLEGQGKALDDLGAKGRAFVESIRKAGGDVQWATIAARRQKAVEDENDALKKSLQAREEAKKKAEDAAKQHQKDLKTVNEELERQLVLLKVGTDAAYRLELAQKGYTKTEIEALAVKKAEIEVLKAAQEEKKKQAEKDKADRERAQKDAERDAHDALKISLQNEKHHAIAVLDLKLDEIEALAAAGKISDEEALRRSIAVNDRIYQIERETLVKRLALEKLKGHEVTQVMGQIRALEDQEARRRLADAVKLEAQMKKHNPYAGMKKALEDYVKAAKDNFSRYSQMVTSVMQAAENSVATALKGMITGNMTFGQAMRTIWTGITGAVLDAVAQMVAQWAVAAVAQAIFGKAAKETQNTQAAAALDTAVAESFQAYAWIPFVGFALGAAQATMIEASFVAAKAANAKITAFATGGLADKATFGVFGEKGPELLAPKEDFMTVTKSLVASGAAMYAAIVRGQATANGYRAASATPAKTVNNHTTNNQGATINISGVIGDKRQLLSWISEGLNQHRRLYGTA